MVTKILPSWTRFFAGFTPQIVALYINKRLLDVFIRYIYKPPHISVHQKLHACTTHMHAFKLTSFRTWGWCTVIIALNIYTYTCIVYAMHVFHLFVLAMCITSIPISFVLSASYVLEMPIGILFYTIALACELS